MAVTPNAETDEQLDILYQDEFMVAITKPSGLLVHRSPIDKHETKFAIQQLRNQIGQRVYPCHRLDKPTSGVLLFALNPEIQTELSLQFESHTLKKLYHAVVRGHPTCEGVIDYPLKVMQDFSSQAPRELAQEAVTTHKTIKEYEIPIACGRYSNSRYALLELQPSTGRKHQLRRHLKHIFHPIIGDTTHGNGGHNRLFRTHLKANRLMLHASELNIRHPKDEIPITITSELPEMFNSALNQLDTLDKARYTSKE